MFIDIIIPLVPPSHKWLEGMDNSQMTGEVLLDFSATFDVIDHNLIGKLKYYKFRSSMISFMKSYLSCSTQRVHYNGIMSHCKGLDCGPLQGSRLEPLLHSSFTINE